jgi:hypothetical protein
MALLGALAARNAYGMLRAIRAKGFSIVLPAHGQGLNPAEMAWRKKAARKQRPEAAKIGLQPFKQSSAAPPF